MKKLLLTLVLFVSAYSFGQSAYENGMTKAFGLWQENKTAEAAQLFERIAAAEKNNWLPSYYAATIHIIDAFSIKDETLLTAKLNKAQNLLDEAKSNSENNAELLITQALLNTAYIAYDGQKYGMTLSGENAQLYAMALNIAPNNPRVVLGKAEWDMGAARFFGQSVAPFCKEIKRAVELFKNEKPAGKFHPQGGIERALEALKQCDK